MTLTKEQAFDLAQSEIKCQYPDADEFYLVSADVKHDNWVLMIGWINAELIDSNQGEESELDDDIDNCHQMQVVVSLDGEKVYMVAEQIVEAKSISKELLDKFTNVPLRIKTRNKNGEVISFKIFADPSGIININHDGSDLQKGEIDQIGIAFRAWWIGLHWFIKSENEKHIIPRKGVKKLKLYEPYGLYLKSIFILCEGCQSRKSSFSWDLPDDTIKWFWFIWEEIVGREIFYVLNQHETGVREILKTHDVNCPDRSLKRGYIRKLLLPEVKEAEEYRNPYKNKVFSNEEWLKSACLYRGILMKSAIELSDRYPHFNTEYYKPFIKAWRHLIVVMESPDYFLLQLKEGDLHVQDGKSIINLSQKYR